MQYKQGAIVQTLVIMFEVDNHKYNSVSEAFYNLAEATKGRYVYFQNTKEFFELWPKII